MELKIKTVKLQNWVSIMEINLSAACSQLIDVIKNTFSLPVLQIMSQQDEIARLKKQEQSQLKNQAKQIKGGIE